MYLDLFIFDKATKLCTTSIASSTLEALDAKSHGVLEIPLGTWEDHLIYCNWEVKINKYVFPKILFNL